jgi:8-oxo-dGTP pyrophosphatase MutT (NUDIX family)
MRGAFDFASALRVGDARLAHTSDLARARETLERYEPADDAQAAARRRMLAFIDAHPNDAHLRTLLEGHLTASALIVDADCERALLTHHKKLGRWLQLGGHCDGDANLAGVALREAFEESGIDGLAVLPAPIDLDIHPIPARANEPEHLHYDTRFVVIAPRGAREVLSDESHALRWFTPRELDAIDTDDSVRRLFRLVFGA